MNNIKKLVFILTAFVCFFAFKVNALAATYRAASLAQDGSTTTILDTDNYNDAKNAMLNANASSTVTPVLYRDGNIVNAKYALVWFNTSYGTVDLYQNAWDTTAYTYTAPSYGIEAAFIDYDSAYNRAKIMISGFTGYVDMKYINIKPLSTMAGNIVTVYADYAIKIRTCPGLSCSETGRYTSQGAIYNYTETTGADGYTWYHIDSGWFAALDETWAKPTQGAGLKTLTYYEPFTGTSNLIHYFMYSAYNDYSFTNLGIKPDYLQNGVSYYSYDGHYFYTDIYAMLDDYRNNTNGVHSINASNPFYNYYMYLSTRSKTGYTADDLNGIISNMGYTRNKVDGVTYVTADGQWTGADRSNMSVMYGTGTTFINAQNNYGVNAFEAFSAAINESAKGTSMIAFAKNNIFGIGASDSNPFYGATSFSSVTDSIIGYSELANSYSNPSDWRYFGGFYGNKNSGQNVKYASDPYWGEKAAMNAYLHDRTYGLHDLNSSTLGITKNANVNIYHTPSYSGKVSYTLKNNSFSVTTMALTVYDKVVNNEGTWYKILTDTPLDANGNKTTGTYEFSTSYGYINANDLYVKNQQPSLNASDVTVAAGANYNLLTNVTATDPEGEDIHESIDVESTNYKDDVAGTYYVNLIAHDKENFEVHKTIYVTVTGDTSPKITALNSTISQYTTVDLNSLVKVVDYDGTALTNYTYTGTVDTNTIGNYKVTYSVTNSLGKSATLELTVNVIANEQPVINASDQIIRINSTFDPMTGVTAKDAEDGDVTVTITANNVNTAVAGDYSVTYSATDSVKQTTTKTIKVTVSNKEEKNGSFYMDYLKVIDNKLMIKGYATIAGMNNTLDNDITYTIIYRNIDTGKDYTVTANRITDASQITRKAYGTDSFDYTYSWFNADMNTDSIPDGDYYIYLRAESKDYYANYLVRNRYQKEEVTSYSGTKSVTIMNDYSGNMGCLKFSIRSTEIVKKTASYNYNQFNVFRTFEWTDDNKIHLYGNAYSYGMNLASTAKRTLIFENKSTYETYKYDLGSTNKALYQVALPYTDNMSKDYAWFDATFDIANLPKGDYVLYIATESNITDISEFSEKLHRSISYLNKTIGDNTYTFSINSQRGNRIELSVSEAPKD